MANQPNQTSNQSSTQNQKSGENQSNQQSRADQPTPVSTSTQSQGKQQGQQGQSSSGDLKQMGREMASDAKNAASNAAGQVKEQVSDLTQNVQDQATNYLGEQKGMAADRLEGVASALRNVGQEFNERDEGTLAYYTEGLAEQIERFSGNLREREIGSLLDDARQLAHRQPEWFVAGALALGFALGRFFKASQRSRYENRYDDRGYRQHYYGNSGYEGSGYEGRGYEDRGYDRYQGQSYPYGNPSDYTEGFSGNYARGYYEGGTTSDYGRSSYRNPETYSEGTAQNYYQSGANPSGRTYDAQRRGEAGYQPRTQSTQDYDAGYRSGQNPEFQGSEQSSSQVTTHGVGTGQSVQREEELNKSQNFSQEETLAANKATQNDKPKASGQNDSPQGARK